MTEQEAKRYGKLNRMEQDQVMYDKGQYIDEEIDKHFNKCYDEERMF